MIESIITYREFVLSCSEREVSFNWIFILIAAIIIVFFIILCGLCIFCLMQNRKRRRNLRMYHLVFYHFSHLFFNFQLIQLVKNLLYNIRLLSNHFILRQNYSPILNNHFNHPLLKSLKYKNSINSKINNPIV